MSIKRRTRKIRRLQRARLRTGKRIVTHRGRSGRTGSMHRKKVRK